MSSLTPATEEIAEKRIGMTLLIHGILLLGSSAIPEEDFLIWFPINLVIEALIIFQLLRMWKRYKNNTATLLYDPSVLDADRVFVFRNDTDCENHVRYSLFLASTDFNGLTVCLCSFHQRKNSGSVRQSKEKKTASSLACILVHSCFYRNTHHGHFAGRIVSSQSRNCSSFIFDRRDDGIRSYTIFSFG